MLRPSPPTCSPLSPSITHSLFHPRPLKASKLTFSTNLFHYSLLAPTWTAFSDYTGPNLLCSTVFFSFLVNIFLFYFGSCGTHACLTASFRVHVNIVYSIFTYLLTYLLTDQCLPPAYIRVSQLSRSPSTCVAMHLHSGLPSWFVTGL